MVQCKITFAWRTRSSVRRIAMCAAIVITPLLASADEDRPMPTGRQIAVRFETQSSEKMEMDYLLFLPKDYQTAGERWPMILFLHGAGERGEDLEKVKIHGPPKIVESNTDFRFIVISPQSRKFGWDVKLLEALLDDVILRYHADPDRIYLTGLSMGGFGTWALASAQPDRFAAIVPICGGGDPKTVDRLAELPAWVFHGAKDKVVSPERSRQMVEALEAAGGNVRLTVYPDAGHDSWTETYDNPELYRWLLEQKRRPSD